MTVHKFTPDRPVTYPFKDIKSLQAPTSGSTTQDDSGQGDYRRRRFGRR
jgi:hypothetical protein